MHYTVMSLTNPHAIRGRPTLKDVEWFRNGSFHEFCRLKALITLEQLITSLVEKRTIFMSKTSGFTGKLGSRIGIENRLKKLENKINK